LTEIQTNPIKLVDENGQMSLPVWIPIAFAKSDRIPLLLGMKGFLSDYPYQFDPVHSLFTIELP
jgi:hypothetical protein